MSRVIRVETVVALSPEQLAAMYWELDNTQQAAFFSELYRLAGAHNLCMQTAAVVNALVEQCNRGDVAGYNGFQTMLVHASEWHESAADIRSWEAKRYIAGLVADAKAGAA